MVSIAWRLSHRLCKSFVFNIPYNDLQTSLFLWLWEWQRRKIETDGNDLPCDRHWWIVDQLQLVISMNCTHRQLNVDVILLMYACGWGWIRIRDVSWQRSDLLIMHVLSPRGRYGARLLYWDIDWCEHLYICMCGLTWSYKNRNIVWVYKTYMYNILKVLRPNLKTSQVQSTCNVHAQGLRASRKCQSTAKVLLHGTVLEEKRFFINIVHKSISEHLSPGRGSL